jgi:hypothetical protein
MALAWDDFCDFVALPCFLLYMIPGWQADGFRVYNNISICHAKM